VAAAIQNILLGAMALNISSFWSTGGMTYHPELKRYLNLEEEDQVIGLLYLG
jgi:nitroreductase